MIDIEQTRAQILRESSLAGWLFHNIQHRDEIADLILQIPPDRVNSRPWVYLLPAEGTPVKIVHEIEAGILDHLPGDVHRYHARADFIRELSHALSGHGRTARPGRLAAQYSREMPVGSFLDHGTAVLLESLGAVLVPSQDLVARILGVLDAEGARSHDAAAGILFEAVGFAWAGITEAIRGSSTVRESDVQARILSYLADQGLAGEAPVVAAGIHSADPHYAPRDGGAALREGDVVQLDLWAKAKTPRAVYADISWVGILAREPSPRHVEVFEAVMGAREAAVALIERCLAEGREVRGSDADRAARAAIEARGFGSGLRHRTGHSIGQRVHGFGVNLDSIEFPDDRPLREGACFSIEPGVYLEDFGMRTEIDGRIEAGRLVISGGDRQRRLLVRE